MVHNKRFEDKKLQKIQILDGAQLKYIAFISMFIDHFNNAIIASNLDGHGLLLFVSNICSIIGRIAFPIFIFFIVEGFFHTYSKKNYLVNLLIFAIISEIPFDMFTSKVFFNPYWNNMIFTLALCLISIWIIDSMKNHIKNQLIRYLLSIIIVLLFGLLAMFLSLDYDYHAIILAYMFYIFYDKAIMGSVLGYLTIIKEVYSFLGFFLILTYNGQRGHQKKWLNYLFYPVHLLILGLIRFYFNL